MLGEDGYQLIEQIQAMGCDDDRHIPVVAITAYRKEKRRHKALSSSFQSYIAKPIELSERVSAIANEVRKNVMQQERGE